MKTTLLVCVLSLVLGLFASAPVTAQETPVPTQSVAFATGSASAFFALPGGTKHMSPLVQKTGHYCGHSCQGCRNDCYGRFRVYCRGPGCRQKFVLCMRHCWNKICRYC